jgi:hypothetical protein
MNWLRENKFLRAFLITFGICLVAAVWFFFSAQGGHDEASARFNNASTELNRLERLSPYPNGPNLRKMKAHAEDYATALGKLKEELKLRVAPAVPMAPNEFQSHLRVALNSVAEKARANRIKLPDKFYLGFDDYVSALPIESAAPSLGQELVEIEWLLNNLLDAHVDAVTAFRRTPLPEEQKPAAAATPPTLATAPKKLFQRNVVETTFRSTPSTARRVINQIAGANQHFCIIRLLHVRNEKDKGPPREGGGETTAPSVPAPKATPAASLNFIVGNEKIETTAKIEIVRFSL